MNDVNIYFGNILRKFRESKKMTQEEFAEACDISSSYYGRIERGEYNTTIVVCKKISDFLGIRIADLFTDMPI